MAQPDSIFEALPYSLKEKGTVEPPCAHALMVSVRSLGWGGKVALLVCGCVPFCASF